MSVYFFWRLMALQAKLVALGQGNFMTLIAGEEGGQGGGGDHHQRPIYQAQMTQKPNQQVLHRAANVCL